ncbi:hypothetical protein KR100_06865 [Synechococcus sp. KORDI-100]|nr:hypothetical protein KR100_06865 [Synechococcus sp. KORDI-100]
MHRIIQKDTGKAFRQGIRIPNGCMIIWMLIVN